MSVSNQISRYQYIANGSTTSFAFPNICYFASELQVIGIDPTTGLPTTYVLDTDYTIDPTLLGQSSGVNVVFGTAPLTGVALTIVRVVPYTQPTQYVEGAAVPSLVQQRTVDELSMQIQQISDILSRTPSLSVTTPIGQVIAPKFTNEYQAYDASVGANPQLSFTQGNHRDSTGGQTIIPTVGGGSPITTLPAPVLLVGSDDTVVFFVGTVNPATGAMTVLDIQPGTSVPADTSTTFYQLMTNIEVVITDGVALVNVLGGGVSGSQNYFYCGLLPATDGSGHLLNS